MVDEPHPHKSTMSMMARTIVIGAIAIVVVSMVFWVVAEKGAARRERAAFKTLCELGATGDDWMSFREIITGSPPIVQIVVPANIPQDTAFDLLANLPNLESLTLEYATLTDTQLITIQQLHLESLGFKGNFPSNSDIKRLTCLRGIRFLYVPSRNLSEHSQTELQSLLPTSQITFH